MMIKSIAVSSALLLVTCVPDSSSATPAAYNPAVLGDSFDKQTFIEQAQAGSIGKNIKGPVGMIATENKDGSLTVTACSGLKSRNTVTETPSDPTPAFDAVVDAKWGLSGTFMGITIGLGGNLEKNVTASPISEASVDPSEFVDDFSARLKSCGISGNAYIIESANLFLMTDKSFQNNNANGSLIVIDIQGVTYNEKDTSTSHIVSVFALPITSAGGKQLAVTDLSKIKTQHLKVIGLPSNSLATKLRSNRAAFMSVGKYNGKGIKVEPKAMAAMGFK